MKDKNNDRGDWMQTFTGKRFYLLDPQPEDIDIIDIAHALSMTCRYGGHTEKFYSVAEHSFLISRALPQPLKLAGLLHDSAEAYVGDVISPVKPKLNGFKDLENKILSVICEKYGCLNFIGNHLIKKADFDILKNEHEQAMKPGVEWSYQGDGMDVMIEFWNPEEAKRRFLAEFKIVRDYNG
jgi:hypothetical protein